MNLTNPEWVYETFAHPYTSFTLAPWQEVIWTPPPYWENIPASMRFVDVIIVGGGGGGRNSSQGSWSSSNRRGAGGGGGGGVLRVLRYPVAASAAIPVGVGRGIALTQNVMATEDYDLAGGGEPSYFGPLVAHGGGNGQRVTAENGATAIPSDGGADGGSGGGSGGGYTEGTGGAGTAGQGSDGGSIVVGTPYYQATAGGGGGAKEVGGSGGAFVAGSGGDGYSLAELGFAQELLNDRGTWSPFQNYSRGDFVTDSNGQVWACQVAHPAPNNGAFSSRVEGAAGRGLWSLDIEAVGGGGGGGTSPFGGTGLGSGGYGGGGSGGTNITPTVGVPRTGGGAGGVGGSAYPGNSRAGSGIVIIRYLTEASALAQRTCDNVGVDQIVYDLARRAGLPPGRIDVSGIELAEDYGRIAGFGIGRSASARTMIEILQRHSFFDVTEIGGIVAARRRDRAPDGVIGGDDLRAHAYGETPPTLARRERIEDYEIPAEVRVEYSQLNAEYEPGVEAYTRRVTDASGVLDVDLSSIAMEPDEAAVIAEATLLEAVVARESIETHLVATDANKALRPGDIKTLQVGDRQDVVRITDIGYAYPGIQRLKMLRHDPSVYSSDARGVGRGTSGSVVVQHGATTFELLDAPLVRELDDVPGYFAAMGGIPTIPGVIEGWPGGDLSREETGGPVDILRMFRPACWFGTTVTALPADAPYTAIDWRPVEVTTSGPLENVTLQEALAGRNFAAVEVREAGFGARIGWELIRFLEADYDSEEGWSINGLLRGVNGTEWAIGLHQAGDRLVVLNNMAQVLTDLDTELGTFWEHNAATIGGEPDPAAAVTFGWFGVDRIPYAPCHLEAERDGSSVFIRWTRRDRVGMELQNGQTLPLSEDSESYLVTIFNALGNAILRTATVSTPEYEYTSANELADFGSQQASLNISVAQVGALGPGYAAGGLIPVEGDAATPPPLPSGDQSRVVITVGGTFDADDTLYLNLQFLEAGVGWHNETFTATGGGKSAIGDYLTDLSAQVGAAFPSLTRSIVGSELTISTTAGTLTGTVTNNTAVVSASLEQEAAPASAGVTYVGTLDFYQSAGGSDVIGPSLSTQYGQGGSLTARLEVVGITYDAAKAIGPGNLAQFNVASNHDFGGEAVSYTAPMGPSVAAIDANGGFATYKSGVSLGTITGTPSPPPRDGVVITLQPNYRLSNQFWQTTPVNVSPSLSPLKYLVKTNRNAEPAFPSGAEQIILVGFTSAGDQVATPQSVVAGQVYKITLGATEFSHTVTSGDAADQRRESILQALADDIDADADFEVDLFTANRPGDDPLAPGTYITQIEIRHADPNTAFAFDAQASYGIEVTVVNEIVPE